MRPTPCGCRQEEITLVRGAQASQGTIKSYLVGRAAGHNPFDGIADGCEAGKRVASPGVETRYSTQLQKGEANAWYDH
jgi:hypothetical protein